MRPFENFSRVAARLARRALSAFEPESTVEPKVIVKPAPGRFRSGARDDYSVDRAVRRSTPEKLSAAIVAADEGDTRAQFEIFEECERDPVVGRCYFKRRLAVTQQDMQILPSVDGDSKAEAAADFARAVIMGTDGFPGVKDWDEALFNLSDGIGKGFAVGQPVWSAEGGRILPVRIEHWPQQNFNLGSMIGGLWAQDSDEVRVIVEEDRVDGKRLGDFPPGQWIVHVSRACSQPIARAALFRWVVWYWLFKKWGWRDWSILLERVGIPPRIGKYTPASTEAERNALEEAVKALGRDHACIYPDSTMIELLELRGTQQGAPHPAFVEACDKAINVAISGSTMSTTQGDKGARSAKESYQAEENWQSRFDAIRLASTIRSQLVAPLIRFNLVADAPIPRVVLADGDEQDLDMRSQVDDRIVKWGYPMTLGYISETYSVPLPPDATGDDLLEVPKPSATPVPVQGMPADKQPPDATPPDASLNSLTEELAVELEAAGVDAARLLTMARDKRRSVDWLVNRLRARRP